MKPVIATTLTPTTISAPPTLPSTPHVTASIATVIVFASIIASLLFLGLYCSFTRRRSVSDARHHLVHQLRASMQSILANRPANVSLPVKKYTKEEMQANGKETEDCPVCLVEFEEGEDVKVVDPGCEHIFHPVCIDRWLAMRDTCPVCRSAIGGDEIEWVEEWREGEEWDEDADMETVVVTEEGDGVEGEEEQGEVVVNVENVVVSGEGHGGEGREGEVVVSGEGHGGEGREGEVVISVEGDEDERGEGEGEMTVNVETVVSSDEDMDGGGRMEMVNLERDAEGGEGEMRVTVENEEVNGLKAEEDALVDNTRGQ